MTSIQIRPLTPEDKPWVAGVLTDSWGDTRVVSYGHIHQADRLPGLVALVDGKRMGLATYRIIGRSCELVTLNSLQPGLGIGTRLVEGVAAKAADSGCKRLWLITTNDNLHALGFYQKRGFHLIELRSGAVKKSRQLKPKIPTAGQGGIPIRDELVLERKISV